MKKPSYLNFSEEQNQNRKSTIQDLLGFAAVGGAGYAGYKSFNSPKEIASALSNLNKPSELRQAGETIGSEIKKSQEIAEQVRRANLDSFVQNLNNRLDDILDASSNATPEERRTFFASFFETVKNEELGTGIDSTDELIKKGYEDISSLDDNQKQVLKDLFNQQIQGSEKNSRRFSSSYKKYEANIGLFSESTDRQVTSTLSQRNTINLNSLASNTDYAKISSKYNELVNLAKGSGATVSLEEVDEGGVKGIYARFNKGSSSETLVLRSGRDKFGNPIVRAGESLQTRYVAPLKVLNAPELVDTRSLRSVKAGNLQQAMNAGMVVDYDDYIFNTFKNRVGGRTGFANFTSRDFVGLNQLIRAPAMYAPDEKGLSPTMENTVGTSRKMFSSSFLIAGLEQFNPKDRAQVNKVLLQAFPQDFAGVSSVQTMVRTYDDPFQRGASLSYSKLGYTGSDAGDINSPFKFLKFYGRDSIDRAVQKQTAREYQMVGREEGISIIRNSTGNYVGSFGVGDSIKTVTGGEDLIGINKEFYGKAAGMNLGGVIFKKRAVDKLGLAEGVAYFGGKIISEQTSTKTINPIGIAETKLFKKLKEKQKQGSIISVGESPTDLNSNYYNIDDFLKNLEVIQEM